MKKGVYTMPCGCTIDHKTDRYTRTCEKHRAEYAARHAASAAERAQARTKAVPS